MILLGLDVGLFVQHMADVTGFPYPIEIGQEDLTRQKAIATADLLSNGKSIVEHHWEVASVTSTRIMLAADTEEYVTSTYAKEKASAYVAGTLVHEMAHLMMIQYGTTYWNSRKAHGRWWRDTYRELTEKVSGRCPDKWTDELQQLDRQVMRLLYRWDGLNQFLVKDAGWPKSCVNAYGVVGWEIKHG